MEKTNRLLMAIEDEIKRQGVLIEVNKDVGDLTMAQTHMEMKHMLQGLLK